MPRERHLHLQYRRIQPDLLDWLNLGPHSLIANPESESRNVPVALASGTFLVPRGLGRQEGLGERKRSSRLRLKRFNPEHVTLAIDQAAEERQLVTAHHAVHILHRRTPHA